ncbi:MAG: hypothetical protein ACYDAC_01665 [Candidatus Dormibacteria bacterium]
MPTTSAVVDNIQQTGPAYWLPLSLALLVAALAVTLLHRQGPATARGLRRAAAGTASVTGLPAWCAASIAIVLWSLVVAVIGFSWDVAWHADLGRDQQLFTPPHVMILVGLAGIAAAALAAVLLATAEGAAVGWHAGRLRIPWASIPMGIMAAGALAGFPLDDYWHSVYGIDVTMWSPTHLLMIGGASLTPIAAWLLLAEAGPRADRTRGGRFLAESLAAATLIGLSTFQLEFDLGIPQWQELYHPVLVALAMSVGLVAAREALGRGGALRATLGFIVGRGLLALLVTPLLGLSLERFPLYLGGALVVEGAYLMAPRLPDLARVVLVSLGIATAGMAAEWGWTQVWSPQPWQPRLLASWWAVGLMAVTGGLLGAALGRAVSNRPQVLPAPGAALAFLVLVATLAVPFPRQGLAAAATVVATPAGPQLPAITREGIATVQQDMLVTVRLDPPDAGAGADTLRLVTWQGGGILIHPLRSLGNGAYATVGPVPLGGSWKTIVFLSRGDVVAAVPVSFPRDPEYGLAAIDPPTTPRTTAFAPASAYLTRESRGGVALPAILADTALGLVFAAWCVAVIGVGEAMRRRLLSAGGRALTSG